MITRRALVMSTLVLLTALLLVAPARAQDTPRPGGILKAAIIGESPTLDLH